MLVYTKILLYPTCLVVVERHNAQPTSSHHHPHPAAHQVLVALPPILDMPLPPIFRDILLYCKIPAFSFVIDNLGMSCFVATDFYWQLVTSTLMPPVMIVLLYLYNFCRGCVNLTSIYCRNDRSSDGLITFTAKRSTGLALLILYERRVIRWLRSRIRVAKNVNIPLTFDGPEVVVGDVVGFP